MLDWLVHHIQLAIYLAFIALAWGLPLGFGLALGVRTFFGSTVFYSELKAMLTTRYTVPRSDVRRGR